MALPSGEFKAKAADYFMLAVWAGAGAVGAVVSIAILLAPFLTVLYFAFEA